MKKILLTLGSVMTVAAPIAAVVSCGDVTTPKAKKANTVATETKVEETTTEEKTAENKPETQQVPQAEPAIDAVTIWHAIPEVTGVTSWHDAIPTKETDSSHELYAVPHKPEAQEVVTGTFEEHYSPIPEHPGATAARQITHGPSTYKAVNHSHSMVGTNANDVIDKVVADIKTKPEYDAGGKWAPGLMFRRSKPGKWAIWDIPHYEEALAALGVGIKGGQQYHWESLDELAGLMKALPSDIKDQMFTIEPGEALYHNPDGVALQFGSSASITGVTSWNDAIPTKVEGAAQELYAVPQKHDTQQVMTGTYTDGYAGASIQTPGTLSQEQISQANIQTQEQETLAMFEDLRVANEKAVIEALVQQAQTISRDSIEQANAEVWGMALDSLNGLTPEVVEQHVVVHNEIQTPTAGGTQVPPRHAQEQHVVAQPVVVPAPAAVAEPTVVAAPAVTHTLTAGDHTFTGATYNDIIDQVVTYFKGLRIYSGTSKIYKEFMFRRNTHGLWTVWSIEGKDAVLTALGAKGHGTSWNGQYVGTSLDDIAAKVKALPDSVKAGMFDN